MNDLMTALGLIPAIKPVLPYVGIAWAADAALMTVLPPPSGTTGAYAILWNIANKIAMNFGNARSAAAPAVVAAVSTAVTQAAKQADAAGPVPAALIAAAAIDALTSAPAAKTPSAPGA
jgi:hypothetical protein